MLDLPHHHQSTARQPAGAARHRDETGAARSADVPAANRTSQPPAVDTRERLIDAARALFLAQGYEATGVKQILTKADARSGSLYHFFPTKEDLLLAVLEFYKHALGRYVMDPVFERVSDPIERIFGVLDGYRRMLQMTGCQQGCPIGNLALEVSESLPAARQLIAENFTGWTKEIERCLDDAADRLPDDVDRAELAGFVLIVMEGGIMQARAHQSIEPYEQAVAHLRDYLDRLIGDASDWRPA